MFGCVVVVSPDAGTFLHKTRRNIGRKNNYSGKLQKKSKSAGPEYDGPRTYVGPAQHLTTAGEELDHLDHNLSEVC